jgi:transposase-like protein
MEDYPRTVLELEDRFSTEEACRDYLGQLRWPDGFVCPRCDARGGWPASRGRFICSACRHQASVTAGTIFQDTHKPLRLWFRAIWHVTSQKNGASAVSLQQVLGLGGYLTAWTWLHKLRLALVVIAAEENGRGIGRIRMARIPRATKVALHAFVKDSVEPSSTVHTDGLRAYGGLDAIGYKHDVSVLLGQGEDAAVRQLPRVHRVASLLKRWLLGTHQGAVSLEHLDYYLDEFTFRFNRRTSASRGKLFYRLLQQAVELDPVPYKTIVGGKPPRDENHNR